MTIGRGISNAVLPILGQRRGSGSTSASGSPHSQTGTAQWLASHVRAGAIGYVRCVAIALVALAIGGTFAWRARHPNQCFSHLSQCFTPKHHSLLQPRLPYPCCLGGLRVGGMATSPLPFLGSPTLPGALTYSHCNRNCGCGSAARTGPRQLGPRRTRWTRMREARQRNTSTQAQGTWGSTFCWAHRMSGGSMWVPSVAPKQMPQGIPRRLALRRARCCTRYLCLSSSKSKTSTSTSSSSYGDVMWIDVTNSFSANTMSNIAAHRHVVAQEDPIRGGGGAL